MEKPDTFQATTLKKSTEITNENGFLAVFLHQVKPLSHCKTFHVLPVSCLSKFQNATWPSEELLVFKADLPPDVLVFSQTTCIKYTDLVVHFCRSLCFGTSLKSIVALPGRPQLLCPHWTNNWLPFSTGSASGVAVDTVNVAI